MNQKDPVRIIGAGMSGLVAAINLLEAGVPVVIHEKKQHPGGRLETIPFEPWPLDRGFQVLLTAYPMTQKYLDYKKLDLVPFIPGAKVFSNRKAQEIGNPLQDLSTAWPTLRYPWATFGDKLKLAKLSQKLKSQSLNRIFSKPESTTRQYLRERGFSPAIIQSFFQPFFGGIFLEKELKTSSRMFEFVLKMFSSGAAAVPIDGIQQLAEQLAQRIPDEHIQYGTAVVKTTADSIALKNGNELAASAVLSSLPPEEEAPSQKWNSCLNLYFSTRENDPIGKKMIGLIADPESLVTNFHFLNQVPGNQAADQSIVSITLVNSEAFSESQSIDIAKSTLSKQAGLNELELVEIFEIKKALPVHSEVKLEPDDKAIRDDEGIYYCGDWLSAPSLNMAMLSGEVAATKIIADLEEKSQYIE